MAILNTTLRTIGPPNELRNRLFATAVQVRLAAPLADPDAVFGSVPGFTRWQRDDDGAYSSRSPTRPRPHPPSPAPSPRPVPTSCRSARAATRSRTSTSSSSTNARRRGPDEPRSAPGPGDHSQGAARDPAQPLAAPRDGGPPAGVHHPAARRRARPVGESGRGLSHEHVLLYLLGIPVLVPPVIAATAIAGERQQGTLEPVLTTPIRREELLLGKALAAWVPSIAIAYLVDALFLAIVALFAQPGIASAMVHRSDLAAQVVFVPLLAAWSIWVGLAMSTRASDARVAQQLSLLSSLPVVLGVVLIALDVISPSPELGVGAGRAVRGPGRRRLVGRLEAVRSGTADRRHPGLTAGRSTTARLDVASAATDRAGPCVDSRTCPATSPRTRCRPRGSPDRRPSPGCRYVRTTRGRRRRLRRRPVRHRRHLPGRRPVRPERGPRRRA